MRPSDHEFETEFGGGLEAWHPDCAGLAWARLYAEAQRARAGEEAAEAKLREAEAINSRSIAALGGGYSPEQVPEAIKQAFALMETVERERDEARVELRRVLAVLETGADFQMGPRGGHRDLPERIRAALGEKP